MVHKQYTREELSAALEASKLSPAEDFERMVRNGLINREGKVTRLIGGEAEPEPGAQRPDERAASEANGSKQ